MDDQLKAILSLSFACVSLLGSLSIIIMYASFPQLRQFAFKMVLFLAIADVLAETSEILSFTRLYGQVPAGLCYFQAMLQTYAGICSMLWVALISWTMYASVVLGQQDTSEYLNRYLLIAFGVPVIFTMM